MSNKIIIAATIAALTMATTAFAQGVTVGRDVGSAQLPAFNSALSTTTLSQATLPENGQNGPVESANSLPKGFSDGTLAYAQAQRTNRWFAQQAEHRFAQVQARRLRPNG